MDIRDLSALELGSAIKKKEIGCREAAEAYLTAIAEKDGKIKSYITVLDEEGAAKEAAACGADEAAAGKAMKSALAQADEMQKRIDAGEFSDSPLAGVPAAVKDNMCIRGIRTTAASAILDTFRPPYDACVVERLKQAGGVFLGKVNMEMCIRDSSKTEHNEVAPAQHEMAPIYTETNVALDHNQLTMEILKKVAERHNMACLLHEKPFAGVNGSGKHTNWSISTDTGVNLLSPGKKPEENTIFLLTLAAVIQAVDNYQDLLRVSVASAGNDHRLGGHEAPPAIISIFLGEELADVVESIISGSKLKKHDESRMEFGATMLPTFMRDNTDRNRTSPFAFTGNRFEFRMTGSEMSIGDACYVLNTIVAESFAQFADRLEAADDLDAEIKELLKEVLTKHKRIIFNGDNYTEAWVAEAEKRGLLNLTSTVEAIPYMKAKKNVELFKKHGIFSEVESHARYDIKIEEFCKLINIEALTMIDMARRSIAPAISAYGNELAGAALAKQELGVNIKAEKDVLAKISDLAAVFNDKIEALESAVIKADEFTSAEQAKYFHDAVIPAMNELRLVGDELETLTAEEYWPFPSYGDMLFSIK